VTKIFISYRRDDDPAAARGIYDGVSAHFGKANVYFDLSSLQAGLDFREQIDEMVALCNVMLVVIGDDWLQLDDSGRSRLENEDDLVRLEVSSALKRDIPVIPVLVGNATIPAKESVPEDLKPLVYRQAIEANAISKVYEAQIHNLITNIEAVDPTATYIAGQIFKDCEECPEMVVILAGSFVMGGSNPNEQPQHRVSVPSFAMGRYAVTFDEYCAFARSTGKKFPEDKAKGRGSRPVINVSWDDAQAYVKWLKLHTGKQYRLPSEAEWEYSARAGTKTDYWWGDDINQGGKIWANYDGCGGRWDGKKTHPVGEFPASPFGLYDTAGNVWEWVEDCWHEHYEKAPDDGSAWLEADGGECARRVIRGGSWFFKPGWLRSAARGNSDRCESNDFIGFRLARDLQD
jgi:formylglycine-generating enzyme required for sulfatase activity